MTRRTELVERYDETSITVLEGLEAVRKRPGMYIGGTGQPGLHHLLWEVIDNSVDEAAAGYATRIEVTLHKDGSCEVVDNGRGIPTGAHPQYPDRSAAEVVFTMLHAGGKFNAAAYAASGGLHGVGLSVVNALSTKVAAVIDRDGHRHAVGFVNGGHPTGPLQVTGSAPKNHPTGTAVRFWPDPLIFVDGTAVDYEHVRDRLAQVSFLVPGTKIVLEDKRSGDSETFLSKSGLVDFVEFLTPTSPVCDPIQVTDTDSYEATVASSTSATIETREMRVDVAFRWCVGYDTQIVSYVNTIPTLDGGTHVAGFEEALVRTLNTEMLGGSRKLSKFGDKGKATRDDLSEGLVAVIRVVFPEPEFEGQTKGRLGTPAAKKLVKAATSAALSEWIKNGRRAQVKAVTDKLVDAVVARVETRNALDAKRTAAKVSSSGLPEKLADCREHGPDTELVICEGDSAAGSIKAVRDSAHTAVLPIRGKILNVARTSPAQALKNTEIQAIVASVGSGFGRDFDVNDSRYGIVTIATDADVDGFHIQALLITFFYQFMRPLIETGRLYSVVTPLHAIKTKDATVYAYSDTERDELVGRLQENRRNADVVVTRFKGLGEMDPDAAHKTLVSRTDRTLKQITVADAVHAAHVIATLMGDSVDDRKAFIVRHAAEYGAAIDV